MDCITGTYWSGPLKLLDAQPKDLSFSKRAGVGDKAHYQRGCVPAAGDDALEWSPLGRLSVDVHGLWVVSACEGKDFRLGYLHRWRGVARSNLHIFEVDHHNFGGGARRPNYNFSKARNRLVWTRLTGISVCFLSSIRS